MVLATFSIMTAKEYRRIVSLAPSVTQSIYSLGAENMIVGCTSYCKEAVSNGKTVVASVMKINIEMLVSTKPDLVIASDFTNEKDIKTIRKFGIEVRKMKTPRSYEEICSQFIELGKWTGHVRNAEDIVRESRERVSRIINDSKKSKPLTIFFQIGADPVYAVIPNMFMNDYIKFVNAKNMASSLTKGRITREFVINGNPDCIFITTMGKIGESEAKEWRKFKDMKAVKDDRIYIIDSEKACIPTPFTFAEALEFIYEHTKNKTL